MAMSFIQPLTGAEIIEYRLRTLDPNQGPSSQFSIYESPGINQFRIIVQRRWGDIQKCLSNPNSASLLISNNGDFLTEVFHCVLDGREECHYWAREEGTSLPKIVDASDDAYGATISIAGGQRIFSANLQSKITTGAKASMNGALLHVDGVFVHTQLHEDLDPPNCVDHICLVTFIDVGAWTCDGHRVYIHPQTGEVKLRKCSFTTPRWSGGVVYSNFTQERIRELQECYEDAEKEEKQPAKEEEPEKEPKKVDIESIASVEYKGTLKFPDGYKPPKSCREHMLEDLPGVMPQVTQLRFIVDESQAIAEDRIQKLPVGVARLGDDYALGVVSYTYDLSLASSGDDNLFEILNILLRKRDAAVMMQLRAFMFFFMKGLEQLPIVEGEVLRGIPQEAMALVAANYGVGADIHWSGITSTTTSPDTAKTFARGRGGIILKINVVSGRRVEAYSAIRRENEVVLSPNTRLVVTMGLRLEGDGFYYVNLQQRTGTGFMF